MDRQKFLDFFFEASLNGWVGNAPEVTISELPSFKVINYPDCGRPEMEGFFYRDSYSLNPETKMSAGFTNIWHDRILIFTAGYGGYYPKEALPFLKGALRNAYLQKVFYGGRGVDYRNDKFIYNIYCPEFDVIGIKERFAEKRAKDLLKQKNPIHFPIHFNGIETISNINDINQNMVIGWHTIWCMTLF